MEGTGLVDDAGEKRGPPVFTTGGRALFGDENALDMSGDGDDAMLAADGGGGQVGAGPPVPVLASTPLSALPVDGHTLGLPLLFSEFLETLVRVCVAQHAVAPARAQQSSVVARHAAAVAAARGEQKRLAQVATEAVAAAGAKGGKGGKKQDAAAAAAATAEAALPRVDVSVLQVPPPTPAAHVVLSKGSAPLAVQWTHFLQHTLLRRHKLGHVGEEELPATLAEEM
jgi:hypothetical protein